MFDALTLPGGPVLAALLLAVSAAAAGFAWPQRGSAGEGRGKPPAERLIRHLRLHEAAGDPELILRLKRAGRYGRQAVLRYLLARLLAPVIGVAVALVALTVFGAVPGVAFWTVILLVGLASYAIPSIYVQNLTLRRREAIRRAWPDALDLLLLSVESGLGIDAALDEVARQMQTRAPELAQELRQTLSELTYLPDRKEALANLFLRTEISAIGTVTTALVQAERYGTPIGTTLRLLSKDSRTTRLAEAERRAAALSPRLTIPMIVFFLPVLFVVIFTPGVLLYFMEH